MNGIVGKMVEEAPVVACFAARDTSMETPIKRDEHALVLTPPGLNERVKNLVVIGVTAEVVRIKLVEINFKIGQWAGESVAQFAGLLMNIEAYSVLAVG